MSYSIVEFSDGVQLVPSQWLSHNNSKCYYPPYLSQTRIDAAIQQMEMPERSWSMHAVLRIFGTSATYEKGNEKVTKYIQVSEIESDVENMDGNISDSDVEEISLAPPKKRSRPTVLKDRPKKKQCTLLPPLPPVPEYTGIENTIHSTPYSSSPTRSDNQEKQRNNESIEFQSFIKSCMKEIIRKLNRVNQRLELIEEKLLQKEVVGFSEKVLDGTVLPIKSIEELNEMETKLEDDIFYKQMVNTLKQVGGNDLMRVTTGILKKVLPNDVAEQYSWAGAKKKLPFKDLTLTKVILESIRVHYANSTDVEIAEVISRWLVFAKLRKERAVEQKIKKSCRTEQDVVMKT